MGEIDLFTNEATKHQMKKKKKKKNVANFLLEKCFLRSKLSTWWSWKEELGQTKLVQNVHVIDKADVLKVIAA